MSEQAQSLLQQLDDQTLEVLIALTELVGARQEWPAWAEAALAGEHLSRADRVAFRRLLRRAWPRVEAQTRMALATVARALGVPAPADPLAKRASAPVRRPLRRTRFPSDQDPGDDLDRGAYRRYAGAGGDPRPPVNRRPPPVPPWARDEPVWTPAPSLAEALHPDEERGWR